MQWKVTWMACTIIDQRKRHVVILRHGYRDDYPGKLPIRCSKDFNLEALRLVFQSNRLDKKGKPANQGLWAPESHTSTENTRLLRI